MGEKKHSSHVTRMSLDSSLYDEACVNCDATDSATGGWGELTKPCPNPIGQGGITLEEWQRQRDERKQLQTTE